MKINKGQFRLSSRNKNLKWKGRNEDGEIVESGIYIYQVQIGESYKNGTLIVAK